MSHHLGVCNLCSWGCGHKGKDGNQVIKLLCLIPSCMGMHVPREPGRAWRIHSELFSWTEGVLPRGLFQALTKGSARTE